MKNGVPGKDFAFSNLRHRIRVQKAVKENIDGQIIHTWKDWLQSEPADYMQTAGGEIIRGKQIEAGIHAVFLVNKRDGYSTEHRIKFRGMDLGIVRIMPVDGMDRYFDIHCKAVV